MKRVLIVDDQPDLRCLLRWSLEELDATVELHEAADAAAALQAAHALRPDVVLLDIMMPGPLDGLEACRRIRASAHLQHTRVVLVTARGQLRDQQVGAEAGAHAYIVKPFSPKQLAETVGQLLASPATGSPENLP